MARRKQIVIVCCLAALCFWGCAGDANRFEIKKVTSSLKPNPEWDVAPPTDTEKQQIAALFSRPFFFLGEGAQAYAFESSDKKYVLKLFKMKRFTPSLTDYLCPHFVKRRLKNLRWVFNGYKIAYNEFRQDTGVVFVHLNKTKIYRNNLKNREFGKEGPQNFRSERATIAERQGGSENGNSEVNLTMPKTDSSGYFGILHQKVQLIDKEGRVHNLDLDQTEYIVQEKAELIFDRLSRLHEAHDEEGLDLAVGSVLDLVRRRESKGYADRDKAVSYNYGFVGERPIHLDVGRLYHGEKEGQAERVERRIERWKLDYIF